MRSAMYAAGAGALVHAGSISAGARAGMKIFRADRSCDREGKAVDFFRVLKIRWLTRDFFNNYLSEGLSPKSTSIYSRRIIIFREEYETRGIMLIEKTVFGNRYHFKGTLKAFETHGF